MKQSRLQNIGEECSMKETVEDVDGSDDDSVYYEEGGQVVRKKDSVN